MDMDKKSPSFSPSPFTAIIVAAGNGSRFGGDIPKQYSFIGGKMVLRHTVEAFLRHPALESIQIVISEEHRDLYAQAVRDLPKVLPSVIGGATRQDSVRHALLALDLPDDALVFIHDAARPCITVEKLSLLLESLEMHQAASLAVPVADTLRKISSDHILSSGPIDRSGVVAMQTPQAFRLGDIRAAHVAHSGQNFTDDTALATSAGIAVHAVTGDRRNIKITTPEDAALVHMILCPSSTLPRTGIGFDVHAFGDAAAAVRIGGVDIPHSHGLKGHSDADVLLHAITDALYGTIADGDIGSHFPPSDPSYKGKDSSYFLQEAVAAVRRASGKIAHVDCVVICEAPKIGPHREAMRARIATLMEISISKVSVKATTTEMLGFTGRREGIAAQALVTIMMPDGGNHDIC